jgi:hypothetical protein
MYKIKGFSLPNGVTNLTPPKDYPAFLLRGFLKKDGTNEAWGKYAMRRTPIQTVRWARDYVLRTIENESHPSIQGGDWQLIFADVENGIALFRSAKSKEYFFQALFIKESEEMVKNV